MRNLNPRPVANPDRHRFPGHLCGCRRRCTSPPGEHAHQGTGIAPGRRAEVVRGRRQADLTPLARCWCAGRQLRTAALTAMTWWERVRRPHRAQALKIRVSAGVSAPGCCRMLEALARSPGVEIRLVGRVDSGCSGRYAGHCHHRQPQPPLAGCARPLAQRPHGGLPRGTDPRSGWPRRWASFAPATQVTMG